MGSLASSFSGESVAHVTSEVVDAIGELTNIVAGDAKTRLFNQGYEFDISDLPTILDHQATPYVPPSMTADEFHAFLDRANREFYLRPAHVLRRLWRTRTWDELMGQAKGALAVAGL